MKPWPKPQSRNKYGAKRTIIDGVSFPSKLEAAVYSYLKLLLKNGEISELEMQPSVKLTRARIGYKPDFKYFDTERKEYLWVEAKGAESEGYRIRKKLWKEYGPGPLLIIKGSAQSFKVVEEVKLEFKKVVSHIIKTQGPVLKKLREDGD